MMRVLITGITGFAGSHLADYILENQPEVKLYGLIRWRSPMENILHIQDKIELHQGN
jgi:GDP-4-dehydro-6-deoxy-D-mannose reductase